MSDDPRCLDIAMLNGENVQCEREWDHAAEGGEPINWHRNGTLIWNTPTHQGGRTMSDDPRVTVPAELVEKLRSALVVWGRDYISGSRGEVLTAARALVESAGSPEPLLMCECGHSGHPDGSCPEWNYGRGLLSRKRYCLCRVYRPRGGKHAPISEPLWSGGQLDKMDDPYANVRPGAPVSEPLCRCGHNKAAHEYEYSPVKGHCSHGGTNGVPECRCARFTPPVPVSDEAEAETAWREWIHECPHLCNTDRCSFLAGFRAARQEDEQP